MEKINELLANILDDAFNGSGWQGPDNLVGTVENATLDQLLYPSPHEGYCIWQIVLHCAYWKWFVLKILNSQKAGEFPRSPADFPSLPGVRNLETWRKDLRLLIDGHNTMQEVVRGFPVESLWKIAPNQNKDLPYVKYVYGVAAHDIYHTGQIRNMGVPNI
ncbi:MAG TPA: DinB family protein [Spirochaetia bacterium]|nr:DinB family protein [Spirochaetia bacterium]